MSHSYADLPFHYGKVPEWLYSRMSLLGGAIVESIVQMYGPEEVLSRISNPFWFQSLGCVLGMDWHSSGITTSVMGAFKRSVNLRSDELGIYICGGKGKFSRETPSELLKIAEQTGLDGEALVKCSKLAAKVDNNAVQDGFQLYLHSFIVTRSGNWAVVQQGMNDGNAMARRYHWHAPSVRSFVDEPHDFIYGKSQGVILNLTDKSAMPTRSGIMTLLAEDPGRIVREVQHLQMPSHHDVRAEDVDLKRLGSVLALAQERDVRDMESLLLLEGVGPRTIQSLTLVSEVIHGTPSRFSDPARFSFAHGGKDGHPFPVPTTVYDETIQVLEDAINRAKVGRDDKQRALHNLTRAARAIENDFQPNDNFNALVEKERSESWMHGGRTVMGNAVPAAKAKPKGVQLRLF